jgi:hypothetical protein
VCRDVRHKYGKGNHMLARLAAVRVQDRADMELD